MKKALLILCSLSLLAGLTARAGEEKVVKGQGVCAKCELGETSACQNAIKAQEDGKTVVYYFAANDTAKKFHKNICQDTAPSFAVGKVKDVNGKKEITASKAGLLEEKTLKGEALCAKCSLKKTKTCQNALRVKDGDKVVIYMIDQNDVSKKFHKNVCQGSAQVTAKGQVADVSDTKKELTAKEITLQ